MILKSKKSKTQAKYKVKGDNTKNEKVKPVENVYLDELLEEFNKCNVSLHQKGNVVKEPEEKKKELSQLKKVSGVIEYFQQKLLDKTKNSIPKYLYDLTMDILYFKKCQNFQSKSNIFHTRLPLIVINNDYYEEFILFLNNYYNYEEFKENITLLKYLILSNKSFKKYEQFHNSQYYDSFAAECINTGLVDIYDINKILIINNQLNQYFSQMNIKGYSIDFYYDKWMNSVIEILFNYILFYSNQTPVITICDKCKKMIMFIDYGFNICNVDKAYLYNQVYEDIKDNETYPKSIDIANNIMNNIDLSKAYYAKTNNNNENNVRDDSSLNVIYYDENINFNRNEIIKDASLFEKECNGTFLLICNIKSFCLIINEFIRHKSYPKFHLICTGSKFENLIQNLKQFKDLHKIIISAVIYTMNESKYSYLKQKYSIIKGIYVTSEQIKEYIRNNKSLNNNKYKISNLITYDQYNQYYIDFHKAISSQYGKLYQKSSYLTALNILQEYLTSDKNNKMDPKDLNLFLSYLEVFSYGPRDYKKIIKEYTNESFYKLFNKWLNETDPLAINKIAFFISGLQLSLNIYGMKEKRGFNCKAEIYRGTLFNYSLILKYVKNIGNIIVFPSFLSTTLDLEIAKKFAQYYEPKEDRNFLFGTIYIINVNPRNDWIAQGFDINGISHYQKEKEILFQPFTFFKLIKVIVNIDTNLCFIYLELVGKKEIWEQNMNPSGSISYIPQENFNELIKFQVIYI